LYQRLNGEEKKFHGMKKNDDQSRGKKVFKKEKCEQTGLVARRNRRGENPFPGVEGGIIMKRKTPIRHPNERKGGNTENMHIKFGLIDARAKIARQRKTSREEEQKTNGRFRAGKELVGSLSWALWGEDREHLRSLELLLLLPFVGGRLRNRFPDGLFPSKNAGSCSVVVGREVGFAG